MPALFDQDVEADRSWAMRIFNHRDRPCGVHQIWRRHMLTRTFWSWARPRRVILDCVGIAQPVDDDVGAGFGERTRDTQADAAGRTGHDGDAARERTVWLEFGEWLGSHVGSPLFVS